MKIVLWFIYYFFQQISDFDDFQVKDIKFMLRYQQGNNVKLSFPNKALQYNINNNVNAQTSNANIIVSETFRKDNQVIKGKYYVRVFKKKDITNNYSITSLLLKEKELLAQEIDVIDELNVTFTIREFPINIDIFVVVNAVIEGNEGFTYNPLENRVDLKENSMIGIILIIIGLVIIFGFVVFVTYKKLTKKSIDDGIAFDEVEQGSVVVDWETMYNR